MLNNQQDQIILRDVHCPYCDANDAFLVSEKKASVISLNFPPAYGLRFLMSCLFLGFVHIIINGFKYFEFTKKTEYIRYGFCPKCGNSYPANAPTQEIEEVNQPKLYKVRKNKAVTGLCRGISEFTGISLLWIRIVTILYFFTVIGGFLYFLIAACVPAKEDIESGILEEKVYRIARAGEGKMIFGLCKGFSDYTDIPVVWVRIMMIIFGFTIIGAILYLVVGLIFSDKAKKSDAKQ